MSRQFQLFLILAFAFVAAVLLLDGSGIPTQLPLGVATAGFVALVCRRLRVPPAQIVCCVLVATTGELLLSLGWGLYDYAHAVIPLYVPPGHGLLYALALVTARQPALRRHEAAIVRAVVAAGALVAVVTLVRDGDTWGLLWWIAAVAIMKASRDQLMLSSCFVYALLLEWAGTANGNWRWAAEVPGLGLTSANPPSGVGVLYVLLDLIVIAVMARLASGRAPSGAPAPQVASG